MNWRATWELGEEIPLSRDVGKTLFGKDIRLDWKISQGFQAETRESHSR
jgi:hypothetical protein